LIEAYRVKHEWATSKEFLVDTLSKAVLPEVFHFLLTRLLGVPGEPSNMPLIANMRVLLMELRYSEIEVMLVGSYVI
jgi:hypothetical protein